LVEAWLTTVNNNRVGDADASACWKPRKGLSIYNTLEKRLPANLTTLSVYDVVVTNVSTMNRQGSWVTQLPWQVVIADEGHDFLRGQHGHSTVSNTLQNWYTLQRSVKAMFIMTGTPFVTKISHDAVRMVQAIAREDVRRQWGPEYTDEALQQAFKGWQQLKECSKPAEKEAQEQRAGEFAAILAGVMLRRDKRSMVRGQPVVQDWNERCDCFEESLTALPGEVERRQVVYQRMRPQSHSLTATGNEIHRMLSYSHRFEIWRGGRDWKAAWAGFDIHETDQHCRAKRMVEILREAKRTGNGVLLFVSRVFLAEFCCLVKPMTALMAGFKTIAIQMGIHWRR
jgi:hypothetical protein